MICEGDRINDGFPARYAVNRCQRHRRQQDVRVSSLFLARPHVIHPGELLQPTDHSLHRGSEMPVHSLLDRPVDVRLFDVTYLDIVV